MGEDQAPKLSFEQASMGTSLAALPELSPLGVRFSAPYHTDGLDAYGKVMSAAGTLFPMALCGLSLL